MISFFENHKKASIFITILIAIAIFAISSVPGGAFYPGLALNLSVIYHFLIFLLLNFFLLISLHGKSNTRIKFVIVSTIVSIFYAVLDEIHQFFVPLRYPSLVDVFVDSFGILTSVMIYIIIKKHKRELGNKNKLNF